MSLNKIQLKAKVFQIIEKLRDITALDNNIIKNTLDELKKTDLSDIEFVSKLLIKEADFNNQKSATAFLYIAQNLCPEKFLNFVMDEINSLKVEDSRKIFLINVLSGLGIKFSPDEMGNYLKNPENAINKETFRFLQNALYDPEARVDFLDFYFASDDTDKKELLESVIEDFEGDKLVNILSPLALCTDDEATIYRCLEIMENEHSLLSANSLLYLSNFIKYPNISKRASKILRKMLMSGYYTEEKLNAFYSEILSDFDPPIASITPPDGNSNFSIVITRKIKDAYFVVLTAINAQLGPFSTVGLSSLTENDFNHAISRFHEGKKRVLIPIETAKKIIRELLIERIKLNKLVVYEHYCWERMYDDIIVPKTPLYEILAEGLKKVDIGDFERKIIHKSPYVQNWFYRYSKNFPKYSYMLDCILELNEENIDETDKIIQKFALEDEIVKNIKTRIRYLAYFLKASDLSDISNMYYSLLFNEKELTLFIVSVLKRSVYEYMLHTEVPKYESSDIFKKTKIKKSKRKLPLFISYIEANWISD